MNREQTDITTGKQIRRLRIQSGMTQEKLAEELNVTRQALSNWERDINEPDLNMLKKICFLFGVHMDDFAKEVITKIEKPKTESGVRQIPMSEKVCEALKRVLANRKGAKDIIVDGYSGFLFLNRDGNPKVAWNYDRMFQQLVKKYNKCHEEALPKVMTPHTLRHTFCTNLANAGMNPKALQYIMGHSNITMTLNYYAHATYASARAEMERLAA